MKSSLIVTVLLSAFALSSCSGTPSTAEAYLSANPQAAASDATATPQAPAGQNPATPALTYATVNTEVIGKYCVSCHGLKGGVGLEDFDKVKAAIVRVKDRAITQADMPPAGPIPQEAQDLLQRWIDEGTPP